MMAAYLVRAWLGIELKEEYAEIARARIEAGYTPPRPKGIRRKRNHKLQKELFG